MSLQISDVALLTLRNGWDLLQCQNVLTRGINLLRLSVTAALVTKCHTCAHGLLWCAASALTLPWHLCPWNVPCIILSCEQHGTCKEGSRKVPWDHCPTGREENGRHTDPGRGIFIPCSVLLLVIHWFL